MRVSSEQVPRTVLAGTDERREIFGGHAPPRGLVRAADVDRAQVAGGDETASPPGRDAERVRCLTDAEESVTERRSQMIGSSFNDY